MKYVAAVLLVLLLVAGGLAGWEHYRLGAATAQLATAQTEAIVSAFEASAAQATVQVITQYTDRVTVVHDATTTLQREIPTYVTPTTDSRFAVPVGFVRVHDAAALGMPLGPPGPADADASPVATSTVTDVIAGNYGICHEYVEQITGLQDWIRSQQAVAPATP